MDIPKRTRMLRARCGLVATALLLATQVALAQVVELRIGGTGNALGAMRLLGDAFTRSQTRYRVAVQASIGSSGAIRAVPKGAIHIGLTSRPLTEAEAASGLNAHEYARTPTVFAVQAANPTRSVTLREVAEIYAGRMTRWPDGSPIRPVMRQPGDDNTQQIARLSTEIEKALAVAEQRTGLSFASNDQETADKLESVPGGFGVTTLGLIHGEKRAIRALALDGVEATAGNARSGRYPLVKRLFMILPREAAPGTREFIAFVGSPAGRKILEDSGHFLP
jgi:phosphate transport system substrate-binding protein